MRIEITWQEKNQIISALEAQHAPAALIEKILSAAGYAWVLENRNRGRIVNCAWQSK
jgi:hypothetical protein